MTSTESDKQGLLLPDGSSSGSGDETFTERGVERNQEDREFVPVIIKRTDEAMRHPDDTLEKAIEEGIEQLGRPALSLTLSAVAAGMIVGFSGMAVAVVTQYVMAWDSPLLTRLASAAVYPLGFVMCIMSGAQLFTEHTATALYPVLDRKSTALQLLRLWGLVVVGNLIGAALIALLLSEAAVVIKARNGFVQIGHHLVDPTSRELFVSAILAGWLMAMGAWLVMATPAGSSQIVSIYVVTFVIGVGGLHHSIAGSAEIFTAFLVSQEFGLNDCVRFIAVALIGNLVGGSVFVGVLNYAHIRKTQPAGS